MDQNNLSPKFHSFGCKVNTYDTGLLEKNLENLNAGAPRVHIINSCAVTEEASREALRLAKRLRKHEPESRIVVTGCAAQVDGPLFDAEGAIDLVVGNSHKHELKSLLENFKNRGAGPEVHRSNIFRKDHLGAGGGEESSHTRSFMKIQDGCNSFCSFCIIPYARGKSVSLPVSVLLEQMLDLQHRGYQEVVLTGVHIGDYEFVENGKTFRLEDLVEELLRFTQIPRVRLTSLEPVEVTDRLIALFKTNERLCPHFHVSVQSVSTKTLKAMKRHYTEEDVLDSFLRIKEALPHAFIGMDVIVGFPGETREDFERTMRNLRRSEWNRIHVFPYSERPGTKATLLDGSVARSERKLRAKDLRKLSAERYAERAALQVGQIKKALVLESPNPRGGLVALSRDYYNLWTLQSDLDHLSAGRPLEREFRITGVIESSGRFEQPLLAELVQAELVNL